MRILLDLDGVLADFNSAMLEVLGYSPTNPDIISVAMENSGDISAHPKIGCHRFWTQFDSLSSEWWAGLKLLPNAKHLISTMNNISSGPNNVFICTSPGQSGHAAKGKIEWVRKHFPSMTDKIVITTKKFLCANPSTILIDDSPNKVDAFREFGGIGVLWPNQYLLAQDIYSYYRTIDSIKNIVKEKSS